ncbi:MerR family transcriptional regulator [Sandaracinus amylolyticus]|uniref:Transcriptional regulator n=1 Tax=Sandaracinus amylolyticus TaxID=927083 RepID=A0A0F6YL72_9BACT|nr:MerR family transcriptional regulator [Sandaracinus amylolyticus]AKF10032.1 transcriptional regulator [Sandaracinus amylolyticus]
MADDAKLWKVGDLARATGISVRTLHWYEKVGLLRPARRTRAGHRVYGERELMRIQQILSLRAVGMSLDEIRALLARRDASPLDAIERHLARAKELIAEQQRLVVRLERVALALRAGSKVSAEDLLRTIEETVMIEKYYDEEQRKQLEQRRVEVGEERIREVEQAWPLLIAEAKQAMDEGVDPADPRMQSIASRWMALVREFTGGDRGIHESLGRMWKSEPSLAQRNGMDPALFEHVGRAIRIANGGKDWTGE